MPGNAANAVEALNRRYLVDYPADAALALERLDDDDAAGVLAGQPARLLVPVVQRMVPQLAIRLLALLPEHLVGGLLAELMPREALRLVTAMDTAQRDHCLKLVDPYIGRELRTLMEYPEDSAGRLMNTRVPVHRGDRTAGEALAQLRDRRGGENRELFLVDRDNRLAGRVPLEAAALAAPDTPLESLSLPVPAAVTALAPRDEVAEVLDRSGLAALPVTDVDGVLLGVIPQSTLVQTMEEAATADIQAMVGASRDERALSRPSFAVRKRHPWLQVNLLTAFLAASVVGLFEDTIARFTALAVLLPVVAGQSGNAGAQALAVTMRGLALREVTARQWLTVTAKEVSVGLANGLGIAITCGLGVYLWSGSVGLVLVIATSMVLAMVIAGFAGAVVPMVLTRLGQDPAQSSSIVLTTVTDVAGFFAFLGIATLLSGML